MGYLHVGGEDSDYLNIGPLNSVDTTAGHFRSGWARCGLKACNPPGVNSGYFRAVNVFSSASFWWTARLYPMDNAFLAGGPNTSGMLRWCDAAGIVRLRVRCTSIASGTWGGSPFVVEKVDAAGTATQLGSSFNFRGGYNILTKVDVNIVYAVAGSIVIYENAAATSPLFSYTGDVTTNSITALTGYDLGPCSQTSGGSQTVTYSEIIVHTDSTLSMGLAYGTPATFGNTHNWSGAVADINEATMVLTDFNASDTAGQLQQFTVNAIPVGSFSVRAVIVGGTAQKGSSGPTQVAFNVRTGGADYFGANIPMNVLVSALPYQTAWELNPGTGVSWLTSQVGSASGFNIGLKSVT